MMKWGFLTRIKKIKETCTIDFEATEKLDKILNVKLCYFYFHRKPTELILQSK